MGGENGGCNGPNGQDSSSPLLPRKLVGLITSTRISSDELNGASMSSHDSKGTTLCIHSVMVVEKARRRGMDVYISLSKACCWPCSVSLL